MTIRIEKEDGYFFLISSEKSSEYMKRELADKLEDLIENKYKCYLFLCDDIWQPATKIVRHLKLKKRPSMKFFFEQHTSVEEFEFFNSTQSAVMFACVIELQSTELTLGIEYCASNTHGHSFLCVQRSDNFSFPSVRDICNYSEILSDSHSVINWERLVEFMKNYEITPLQKWSDSYECSLKFYNLDLLNIFKSTRNPH
jgi:hypothetical protein